MTHMSAQALAALYRMTRDGASTISRKADRPRPAQPVDRTPKQEEPEK